MHTWRWQTWQGLPYLTCSLLEDWAHGFFTQQFSPRSPLELTPVLHPTAQTCRVKQVHGSVVLTPSEAEQITAAVEPLEAEDGAAALAPADGLLSEHPQQAVWVCSADCVPALIADRRTGQVAAVHAGWRGTAGAIVPAAIARLQAQGSQLADLCVALGPAIAGEVYQVSTTVAATVGATIAPTEIAGQLDAVLAHLQQQTDSPLLDDPEPGRARLDVRRVNVLQLQRLGMEPAQIAIAPFCTYQHAEYFFSYRRDRLKLVQWSGIVSRSAT